MEIEEKHVKVKMSICPECGNAVRVSILHTMTKETTKDFMKEVSKFNLDIKTISLEEYRKGITLGCEEKCSLR